MLERSTKILKRMGRRVLTNKYMWCLIGLIFAGIVFIIVWQTTGHQEKKKKNK